MKTRKVDRSTEAWAALALCVSLFASGLARLLLSSPPAYARSFAPEWLPLIAATVAAAAIVVSLTDRQRRPAPPLLGFTALLLLLWTASGLPLDLLRVASLLAPGLMPPGVDWPGLVTRLLALAALVVLAHYTFRRSTSSSAPAPATRWYGYAALGLALVYPALKTWWALGGDFGLRWPGADGLAGSFALWLPAVPWLLAAALSLLLVQAPRWMPRRLMLVAGWSATVIVAMVGPAAFWSVVPGQITGDVDYGAMAGWVYGLVYGSWFLWALAAAAATRSYQSRSVRTS